MLFFFLSKKSQASFEYLAVFALGFIMIIPMTYVFQQYSLQSTNQVVDNRLINIGSDIKATAESVYYMGYPSRLTLIENFPEGIKSINVSGDATKKIYDFSIFTTSGAEYPFISKINITGNFTSSDFSAGQKNIKIETRNTSSGHYVFVDIY
jgi:hypothetical protein